MIDLVSLGERQPLAAVETIPELVSGPNGFEEVTIKIPGLITSPHAVIVAPGFLGGKEQYENLCAELAASGMVAATSNRLSPESTTELMKMVAKETDCKTFHMLGHSDGGPAVVEVVEFVDGENIETLTLAATHSLSDHSRLQMVERGLLVAGKEMDSIIPAARNSITRRPLGFPLDVIDYVIQLGVRLPEHVHHGLEEVAPRNISEKLAAIRETGRVAIGGMYFPNDAFIPEREARAFEYAGNFDVFHMVQVQRAGHLWLVTHPRESAVEYRREILARLDPVYAGNNYESDQIAA